MKTSVRHSWLIGLSAVGLAVLIDQLFWKKPAGISIFIWFTAVILVGFALSAVGKVRPDNRSFLLAVTILVFAGMTFIRRENLTRVFSALAALGLLLLLAMTFRNGNWTSYRTVDYLTSFFKWLGAAISRPFELVRNPRETASDPSNKNGKPAIQSQAAPILRGLLLALPVIFILTLLLSSADPIFKDRIQGFFNLFRIDNLAEFLFRLLYILAFSYLFAGSLLQALHPQKDELPPDPDRPEIKPFLGFTESAVVLLCVDLLFLVFVIIQFRYLFGGQVNIAETGYTYSEYARRGFFELVSVAVISLLLYLALAAATRKDAPNRQRAFTTLSLALVLQVLIILVSAWLRLQLYEEAYGFTRLRTYTHIFIPWLGVLLAATILLEIFRKRGRFALFLLGCSAGFVLTLGIANIDALIVKQNVQRAVQGEDLDMSYLASLSKDAVPAQVQSFQNAALPGPIRDLVGASLACRLAFEKVETGAPETWGNFHLADLNARRQLEPLTQALSAYPVSWDSNDNLMVKIKEKTLPCRNYESVD